MAEAVQSLGRYKLQRKIGTGAMGVVYEALDPKLARPVAIKTILKSHLDEEVSREYSVRFREEAQAVARLNHPNIVQVYDFGEEGDVAFIVMEFIRGKDLKHCFDANLRFEPKELVRLMCELLSALDYAHQNGIVHRDIKPANIMLDVQSRAKLMDFGVARMSDSERTHRTQVGTMVGTPSYMSPEQVQGLYVDHRSDLFSSGIVLYQFLTGQRPFTGGDWTLRKMIVHDDPVRPSQLNAAISPEFDRVVSRALAKAPEARYQSAADFGRALQRVIEGKPAEDDAEDATIMRVAGPPVPPPRPPERQPTPPTTTGTGGASQEVELEFWRSIKDSDDPEDYELYLQQFPNGTYARLAERKIGKLRKSAPDVETSGSRAEAEARRLREEERARQEAEARTRQEAEARARQEAEARARREAAEKLKRDAEEKARLEAERVRRESEERARREAEARAKREAEEKARLDAERIKRENEEKARRDAEAKAKRHAEEKARLEAEEKARREAEAKTKREAEEKAQREAEARGRREAEEKARREAAEAKAKREAEEKARREAAEAKAKREAEEKARRKADEKARREAEAEAEGLAAEARSEAERPEDLTVAVTLPKAPRRNPIVIPAVAGAVLAIGAAAAYFALRSSPEETAVVAKPPPPQVAKVDSAPPPPSATKVEPAPAPPAPQVEPVPPRPAQPSAEDKAKQEAAEKAKAAKEAAKEAAERARRERAEQQEREKAAKLAEEQKKREAATLAAEEERKRDAARLAEETKKREEARAAAEEQKKREAARLAAEEEKKKEAARLAAEEEKKKEAIRLAAAKQAEEQKRASGPELFQRAAALEGQGKVAEAVKLYTAAANSDHGPSAKRLGDIFSGGKGDVAQDYTQSLRWYERARRLGEKVQVKGR